MNYPPLLPKHPITPFVDAVPTPAPKRRAVAVACDTCRTRKIRCTAEVPTCAGCQGRGEECHYADVAKDREVDANQLKKRVKELEAENRNFRALFERLKDPDARTSQEMLERIRAGDELEIIIEHARDLGSLGKRKRSPGPTLVSRQRPSDWTTCRGILPRNPITSPTAVNPVAIPFQASTRSLPPTPLASPPINTPTSPTSTIPGLLTQSQNGEPDAVLLKEARPREHCDPRLNALSISYWTRVPISSQSAATLISTFLETDNSTAGFIDANLFITDLVQHNSTFCSAFLVSSILYLACLTHTASDDRAATLAQSFFNDSERLYRAERLSDNLTTFAAMNIFGRGCFFHGNYNLSRDLLFSGRQMGKRMNLYGPDSQSSEVRGFPELLSARPLPQASWETLIGWM